MPLRDPVNWNADALVVLDPGEPAVPESGGILFKGILADAVAQFLDLPQAEREHAEIVIVHEGGTWNTWLMPSDIEELGLLPDYPLRTRPPRSIRPRAPPKLELRSRTCIFRIGGELPQEGSLDPLLGVAVFPAAVMAIAGLVWAARGTCHPDEHPEEITDSDYGGHR